MSATFEKLMNGVDGGLSLLQVLAENSFDSVLITDASAEGKITYANKAFKKLRATTRPKSSARRREFFRARQRIPR